MNVSRADLFWHARAVQACLPGFGAQAAFDVSSLTLEIRAGGRSRELAPRFHVRDEGRLRYSTCPGRAAVGFAGWLPYAEKRWPLGDKIAFKEFCLRHGLPTPPMWRSPAPGMSGFLVKRDRSSYSEGMRGPFRSFRPDDPAQVAGDDRYYEQFIPGRPVKAWFWEERLTSIEMHAMPMLTGDGASTLRELMQRARRPGGSPFAWEWIDDLARFQDATLDAPLEAGRSILADIRWGSSLIPARIDTGGTLERYRDSALLKTLQEAGPVLWNGIPEDIRRSTLFTVDGVVDASDRLWLLEMTCDAPVHPESYPAMLKTLLAERLDA